MSFLTADVKSIKHPKSSNFSTPKQFDFIPDDTDDETGGDDGEDDGEVLEPWAISLIVVGGVAVIGGIGYGIFKKQSSKKTK